MIVEAIAREVREACGRPGNVFTPAFYDRHLAVVAKYSAELAAALGADGDTVALAAWLHDISAVLDFATLPEHPAASARIAGEWLARHGDPAARSAIVADAIRRHSTPLRLGEGSPEAICLSNADAMAQIAAPDFWLYFAFRIRNLGYEDGRRWYQEKVRTNWEAIIPAAQEIVRARYREVVAALQE